MSEDISIRELPGGLWEIMKDEWKSRTTFGKLFYRLWFLESAILLMALGSFLFVVWLIGGYNLIARDMREAIPETHKEDIEEVDQ